MRVVASAPGKLVITGEYAVLEGAPALVLAVDREARVELEPSADGSFQISAAALGMHDACGQLDAAGRMIWPEVAAATVKQLALVSAVLETLAAQAAIAPFRANLDTRAFYADTERQAKLGLGSSAALTVALAGAINALSGHGRPRLDTLIAAHRRAQNGRGSGLDIAASLFGGLLVYRWHDGLPHVTPTRWPDGLAWCCVWSGKSASTSDLLRTLEAWRAQAPARYTAVMGDLGDCARAATTADGAANLLEAVAGYALALDRLAAASGLDIFCAEHRHLRTLAAHHGVIYKTCGAGGGDIGIALATDPERLQAFRQAAAAAGFLPLDLKPASAGGLRLH